MGVVYEAEQHGARDFIKRVAIKVIRQSYANQKQFIEISSAKPSCRDLITQHRPDLPARLDARFYYIAME